MTESGYHILETLSIGYLLRHSVLLLGPTSTGKSFLIKWLAHVLGYEHLSYSINPYTSKFEIIGGIKPDREGQIRLAGRHSSQCGARWSVADSGRDKPRVFRSGRDNE